MAKKDKNKNKNKNKSSMRDRARERAEKRNSESGGSTVLKLPQGTKYFKPKKGSMAIDVVPYIVTNKKHPEGIPAGEEWFRREYIVHRGIGVDENDFACLKNFGKKCPACEEHASMLKDRNADEDAAAALKGKKRELWLVRDANVSDSEVMIWDMSYHLFGKLLDEELAEGDEEWGGFAELEGGMTLEVRFKEKKFGSATYYEASRIDFESRDDIDLDPADLLALDDLLIEKTYDELAAILYGTELDEEPEEEEEEKPPKKSSSKKPKDEEPEEEEPEAEEPEEEEEEPEEDDGDDLDELSRNELKKLIKKEELEVKVVKSMEDDDIREAIREARAEEPEAEEEEPEEDDSSEESSGECPSGYEFGTDNDEFDECMECDSWDACKDRSDELKKKK
jgi:hypothetical protein